MFFFCVAHCLSFFTFSFDHCIVCPSLIYNFWLPCWCIKKCNFRLFLHIFFYRHLSHAPVNYFMIIFSVVRRWEKFLICNSLSRCNNTNICLLLVKIGKEYLCSLENSHPSYIHIFQDLHLFGQYDCMKTFIGCEIWN